ncbi:hypothetical protein JAAARDRAFT_82253 [Jaapia argillacea MUCL 33604]|uniref:Very-long-chain 3-oxoacyl-CoA reductase n=1 Tax=Jaapia argillacea MUCL 33604 TaxID=933084 RepID=A0A067PE18_9AGAM|nr:hypothetical protein JAAARDRAFT_82253 [Jaapia argillacea MUCL 33604]
MSLGSLATYHPGSVVVFFSALGFLTFVIVVVKTLSVFVQTFMLKGTQLRKFGAKSGSWAVVTGASGGIGREFAIQLGKAGFNVLVASRNYHQLAETVSQINANCGTQVQTKIVIVDLSNGRDDGFTRLVDACQGMDIGILVNNAGKSHEMPSDFAETPKHEIDDIVAINISAVLRVTSIVLPGMIQRKRGLILNIGSFAGSIPSPMLATYSGSKAFLSTWSTALGEEVTRHGITVQHLNTYFVVSDMSKIRRSSALVPTPASYVRSCLSKIGLSCGAAFTGRPHTCTPFWSHAFVDWGMGVIGWKSGIIAYTHRLHRSIRARALRKKERDAKSQ